MGFDVFKYLPKNDQLFNYTGKNQTFADCADEKDARNCAILENISQNFFKKYSNNFNFDNLKIEPYNVTSATDQTTITGFSAGLFPFSAGRTVAGLLPFQRLYPCRRLSAGLLRYGKKRHE